MIPDETSQARCDLLRIGKMTIRVLRTIQTTIVMFQPFLDVGKRQRIWKEVEHVLKSTGCGWTADRPIRLHREAKPRVAFEIPFEKIVKGAVANDPHRMPDQGHSPFSFTVCGDVLIAPMKTGYAKKHPVAKLEIICFGKQLIQRRAQEVLRGDRVSAQSPHPLPRSSSSAHTWSATSNAGSGSLR